MCALVTVLLLSVNEGLCCCRNGNSKLLLFTIILIILEAELQARKIKLRLETFQIPVEYTQIIL